MNNTKGIRKEKGKRCKEKEKLENSMMEKINADPEDRNCNRERCSTIPHYSHIHIPDRVWGRRWNLM